MKATELRIGNILNYQIGSSIEQGIVTAISHKIIVIDYKTNYKTDTNPDYENNYRLIPIPLTEEWLLKFGFEIRRDHWYWLGNYFAIVNEPAYKEQEEYWVWQVYDEGGVDMPHFKYVHQLQNLYFALTGEELTIKDHD